MPSAAAADWKTASTTMMIAVVRTNADVDGDVVSERETVDDDALIVLVVAAAAVECSGENLLLRAPYLHWPTRDDILLPCSRLH